MLVMSEVRDPRSGTGGLRSDPDTTSLQIHGFVYLDTSNVSTTLWEELSEHVPLSERDTDRPVICKPP